MPLDPFTTKAVVITIAIAMYSLALLSRRLSATLVVLSFLFLTIGAPLGYDTLMYSIVISSGNINSYGPLWTTLGLVVNWANAWWLAYLFAYIVIVFAFVALARLSAWPSLLLATLTTLPGLGFDFLSVMRQGLSTAFVIFYYLALRDSRTVRSLVFATLAFLGHPAGLFAVVVLLFVRFRYSLSGIGIAIAAALAAVGALSVALPDFFEAQVSTAMFLWGRYLMSDATIENDTGSKLFVAWVIILAMPVLLAAVARRIRWCSIEIAAVALFLAVYGLLFSVSGSSVRLIWFFLPMLMAAVVSTLVSRPRWPVSLPARLFFAATCFATSAYVLSIAPEHFWEGDYPHEIHVIQ